MIKRKSAREIDFMRQAGRIAAGARNLAGSLVNVGATTKSIDKAIHDYIISQGAKPAFLGYRDYPASSCISVNEEVIHAIPSARRLVSGDIVSIDIGVVKCGYIGDCAATFVAGQATEEAKRLIRVTRECFYEALKKAKAGNRVSDISRAVQQHAEKNGYSVVREYTGHGVGSKIHEPPEVPNFVEVPRKKADPRLMSGMTIAIEPMINEGGAAIFVKEDDWTVTTADGKNSAHYENTILITEDEPEILTACED
ncbi:MAG: type I methionyl aminopeptidase [Oscillospiraceae bacterium]|nr:type I methionyl aminopeptidase [Oscillospiraceae bacterium]MCL2279152.1 type I methionyl aminopeptidase [Oscillospiraceae bacterium]